jgi:uncharacterized protein (DUF885 family)
MTAFSERLDQFVREFFVLNPLHATAAGMHDHDGRWPDVTAEGRYSRLAFYDEWTRRLAGFDDGELSADERIDRDLVLMELDAARFGETRLREEAWDPLSWVYLLGGGIFPLLARDFAPLADRLASVAGRLEGVPAVVTAARAELTGHDGRPVSRFHTETALRQVAGIEELIADALAQADAASADPGVTAVRPRLEAAAGAARSAMGAFEVHLRDDILPRSEGEGRLGAELFGEKLRHTLKSEMTPDQLLARARHEYEAVRAEMIRLARDLWPTWVPDRPRPTAAGTDAADVELADRATVRDVLDAIATAHPEADDILQFCRDEMLRIEDFIVDRSVLRLADEPLEIRWTPVFMRSFGGAMLDSPGPLDRGQKAFFSVTPIPEDWTPEQAESYLREDNDRMLRLLTIHEAVPGHYLQGVYANRCPSLARAIFWSGVFAEGWAVYVTQVMMDLGYGADDPALMLVHWKFYIRAVINSLIDVGIHAGSMTEDEALALMIDGGFQEESEARNKWNRARLTSTQLSTYFVGSVEMWDLEEERRRRAAVAAGDPRGAGAVPAQRVVGNFGPTPGFDYRAHLESVISHGSPPMVLLRRLLLDDTAG